MGPSQNPVQFQQQVFGTGEYKFGRLQELRLLVCWLVSWLAEEKFIRLQAIFLPHLQETHSFYTELQLNVTSPAC